MPPGTCPFSLTPSIAQTSFDLDPMGVESGGQRGRVPKVTNLGEDVLSRIENAWCGQTCVRVVGGGR